MSVPPKPTRPLKALRTKKVPHLPGDDVAETSDMVAAPLEWDKAVSCAYLRMMGNGQKKTAAAAGVGERTLARWEGCPWWEQARAEARARWMNDVVDASRYTLLTSIQKGDVERAVLVLERMDPSFRPNPTELHVKGLVGVVQQLPPAEVARLAALPEPERRAQLQLLASGTA